MKKSFRGPACAALCLALALASIAVFGAETARTVTIYKIEGKGVTMTKGGPKSFAAKEKTSLADGWTVATGSDSACYLRLDTASFVKIAQNSKIQICKISNKKLSVSVLSGGVCVDAAPQAEGETVEIKAGASALAIRGTLFTAEYAGDGSYFVVMLEGGGELGGRAVNAGETLRAHPPRPPQTAALKIDSSLSLLTLQTINEHADELIESGVVTRAGLGAVNELIETKTAEAESKKAQAEKRLKQIKNGIGPDKAAVIRLGGPAGEGGGGGPEAAAASPQTASPPEPQFNNYDAYRAVTYNLNGGSGAAPFEAPKRAGELFPAASAEGLSAPVSYETFLAWNTAPDGGGLSYAPGAAVVMPPGELTLYAVWGGNGTLPYPFQIKTAADLAGVGAGGSAGAHYRLMNDIGAGAGIPLISNFDGTFDGQFHTITVSVNSSEPASGLFGTVSEHGTVKNLTVAGSVAGAGDVGGIAVVNHGEISNCRVEADVYGQNLYNGDIGGVAATNLGTISNCVVTGSVSGYGANDTVVGGIAGYNYSGTISNCVVTGSVSGNAGIVAIGGVAGGNIGVVTNCRSTADISGNGYGNIGGVVGENGGIGGIGIGNVSYCCSTGTVTGTGSGANVGGIIGLNGS